MEPETTPAPVAQPAPTPAQPVTPAPAAEVASAVLTDYFFPTYNKTIQATSKEEAEAKLQAILNTK